MPQPLIEKFKLSFWDIFYNPYFIIRSNLYKSIKAQAKDLDGSLMDFGCGTKPYQSLFTNMSSYTGVDFDGGGNPYKKSGIDVYYNGKDLPFGDNSFDSILSTEVIEHIFNPDEIISELNRVLKPGGKLLLTCPFSWPEHEQPWDYARYSSFGIRNLLEKHGFVIEKQEKTGSFFLTLLQLIILYFYILIPKIPLIQQLLFLIFCFPLYVIGLPLHAILPAKVKRKDLYLNNVLLARKPS